MDQNRAFYKMEVGGKAERIVREFMIEYREIQDAWREFLEKYDGEALYAGAKLQGLVFENGSQPTGWKSTSGMPGDCYRPLKKLVPEQYDEMAALPVKLTARDLTARLGIDSVLGRDAIHYATFEELGDDVVLSIHKESKVPDGASLMKMSEYWAIKEAA